MRFSSIIRSAAAGAALFAATVAADASSIDPIVVKGKHFFYKTNGTEFFIRGVAYQQDYIANATASTNANYVDPLADIASCNRDIPYLVQLRTNVIRTYAIDPTKDHSACMNALANAGIYVISDLSQPTESINRDDPNWTTTLYSRYTAVIDNLSQYNNVIGFFAGNEVSNSFNTTAASAYVKAAVRDSKAYIKAQNYRTMYVGYATYDGPILNQLADYFNCGDQASAIDFWGYNIYSWCGMSDYESSGYQARTQFFSNYSVPAFFAEYGCNTVQPRPFTEVQALYGTDMTPVWSGGIVYMYFQETNNFGLVSVVNSASVSLLPDFTSLSAQMAMVTPSNIPMSLYPTNTLTVQACPTLDASWSATPTPLPPTPNSALCNCMEQSLACSIKNSSSADIYGDLFDYICAQDSQACSGIASNGSTGVYGAFSGCTPQQQLSFVMNRFYLDQSSSSGSGACDFSGNATLASAASPSGTCASLLSAAGTFGTGTVATPTGKSSGTGTAAASSGATTSGAAAGLFVPNFEFGMLQMGLYVFGAVLTGAGMILL